MQKVRVFELEKPYPEITKKFLLTDPERVGFEKWVPGCYAWKPVAIKHCLEIHPHTLWIDAGVTILRKLDDLFDHIRETGYFLTSTFDNQKDGTDSLDKRVTNTVKKRFNLNSPF